MTIIKRIVIGGTIAAVGIGLAFLIFQFIALFFVFSDVGYEEGGQILFINKKNPDVMILKQLYLSGAWDGETTTRIVKKNINKPEVEAVDTSKIDKSKWIQIKVHRDRWGAYEHGVSLGPERFKEFFTELNNAGKLTFKLKNIKQFKELQLPLTELPEITTRWNNYSDNTFSEKFRTYVFHKYDALVLNTMTNDFSNIDEIVLMKKDAGPGYTYHLHTTFISENEFSITQTYLSFEVDSFGIPKNETLSRFAETNDFEITDDGEIIRTTEGIFGKIVVN